MCLIRVLCVPAHSRDQQLGSSDKRLMSWDLALACLRGIIPSLLAPSAALGDWGAVPLVLREQKRILVNININELAHMNASRQVVLYVLFFFWRVSEWLCSYSDFKVQLIWHLVLVLPIYSLAEWLFVRIMEISPHGNWGTFAEHHWTLQRLLCLGCCLSADRGGMTLCSAWRWRT